MACPDLICDFICRLYVTVLEVFATKVVFCCNKIGKNLTIRINEVKRSFFMAKYDVGIFGLWYGHNYGSIITYYALSKVIRSMGYSYAMIKNPLGTEVDINSLRRSHALKFAQEKYKITPMYSLNDMYKLNDMFDKFIIGSDQMWNYGLSRPYRQSYFLDFADDKKIKISYATSFGKDHYTGPDEEREVTKLNLNRFDSVSVRDDFSKRICEEDFGVEAELVLDPVFVCDKDNYLDLIKESGFNIDGNYIFAYLLDPNPEMGESIQKIVEETGKKLIIIFNESSDKKKCAEALNINSDKVTILEEPTIKEWLYCVKNADFVLTDSFHGACFSIIFHKNFIVRKNNGRGGGRFSYLLSGFELTDRMFEDQDYYGKYMSSKDIDYKKVDSLLKPMVKKSYSWLKTAFKTHKKNKPEVPAVINPAVPEKPQDPEVIKLEKSPDFRKIRILATLLRDYGVKHVVLSPGGRDVPIVRMFEYNEGSFILHRVTDERSAAYFGLGIATQLRQPVACVCTSGTAASNYLPAVTEAYYTGIPLIMITADRYNVYHEHGEDQTIPQQHIYDGVVKKSITVPEGSGNDVEYQTRRDISDCILESTHDVFGPVHINIAIGNITVGSKAPRSAWKLLPKIYPHILRVGFNSGNKKLMEWVNSLKRSQRIMVVYGQNPPLNEIQKRNIENFAKKYNCVIITDHISNLDCQYAIKPHNLLAALSGADFNENLSPDILITVGGKRLMNDPLTSKIRGGRKDVRHWSVTPDGKIKDFYFRLTSVIEMSQDKFFEWFSAHAGDIENNGQYFDKWQKMMKKYGSPEVENFTSNYIQSKFFPAIPSNSVLHLGVGQSFYDCRRYSIDSSVEVYCNMGTNGIDGCTSTFLGQCSVVKDKLCFLIVGDLSFFYDMNSLWNKELSSNIRILMVNNNGTGLLRGHNLKGISSVHNTSAKGWVESTGFKYISASDKKEFLNKLPQFLDSGADAPLFFEVFCQ